MKLHIELARNIIATQIIFSFVVYLFRLNKVQDLTSFRNAKGALKLSIGASLQIPTQFERLEKLSESSIVN